MAQFSKIEDSNLRKEVQELDEYLRDLIAQRKGYSPQKLQRFRDSIVAKFSKYIRSKRDRVKKPAKKFDTTQKNIKTFFDQQEQDLIDTFEKNLQQSFSRAASSIEKNLDLEGVPFAGIFGVSSLLSLIKRRPKLEKGARIDGVRKQNRNNRLFRIDLIPYLILVINTAQVELKRRLSTAVAIATNTDLVRISEQRSIVDDPNEVCNRWRDRIVSLSGINRDFPALSEATSEKPPLFHPNCRHTIIPLTQEEQQIAISKNIKTYTTLRKNL